MKLYSFIIPCYNEELSIQKNVSKVIGFLNSLDIEYEIICVNDGSKDFTLNALQEIKGINIVSYDKNHGKGYAVKKGIEASKGDYIVFMDADLSTDLSAIKEVISLIDKYPLLIGSRHTKGSKILIKQPLKRRIIGKCCRIIVNALFHFHLKDTQCGFKAIQKDLANLIISKQITMNWAFDVEYIYIAKLNNYSIKEIPVLWKDDRTSTVKRGASFNFLVELIKIKKNKKYYKN